jgi:hypothetical protein
MSGSGGQTFSKFESSIKQQKVPSVGDETIDYRIKFDIASSRSSGAALTMTMCFDMEFVRTGGGIGAYTSLNFGSPDTSVAQPAIKDAVARMSAALG